MANENEVSVTGTADRPKREPYRGMSPLTAGLMYGGAASTVMGPLGLLVGVGYGIAAKRAKDNFLDKQARDSENTTAEYAGLNQELDAESRVADPDEKRLLAHAKRLSSEGWYRLESGDPQGRAMIDQANAISRGIMSGDIAQRKAEESQTAQFQRGLIGTAANDYRTRYSDTLKQSSEIDKQVAQVLSLVAQPGFDPNKPFNKAVLTDLISVGVNGLSKNDPDGFLESLPVAGPIIKGIYNDEKYNLTGEDFNRVALAIKDANGKHANASMQELAQQAQQLDTFARQKGAIPQDYSLADYVSGGVKELRLTPVPRYTPPRNPDAPPTGMKAPPSEKYVGGINSKLRGIQRWMDQRDQKRRPTN